MIKFEIAANRAGEVNVMQTSDCSQADTDVDYIFDTDNDLIRIQSDNIMKWKISTNKELEKEMKKRDLHKNIFISLLHLQ